MHQGVKDTEVKKSSRSALEPEDHALLHLNDRSALGRRRRKFHRGDKVWDCVYTVLRGHLCITLYSFRVLVDRPSPGVITSLAQSTPLKVLLPMILRYGMLRMLGGKLS